jgi:hypothetical protein
MLYASPVTQPAILAAHIIAICRICHHLLPQQLEDTQRYKEP